MFVKTQNSMTPFKLFLAVAFIFSMQSIAISQTANESESADEDKTAAELKNYFWNQSDSSFRVSEIPEKWKNESAVVIARRIEYSVKKKNFSNKLLENYYFHIRVKLLDNNAIEEYSEFSFRNKSRKYRGAFSFETINYYAGVKVEKPNGEIVEVSMDDAVEKEISQRRQSFSYNKLAIPNLQIGDIVDIYHCTERKFPISGFHEFAPVYYELSGEYPILSQTIRFDILRNCYLNAKPVNGAPELQYVNINAEEDIYSFELADTNRDKLIPEEWSNANMEVPALKFQAYYAGNMHASLTPGYQSFFGPLTKLKSEININALGDLSVSMRNNVVSPHSPYRPLYQNTLRYIKKLSKQSELTTEEMAKEAYYFIRELWYQQYFHTVPQILNFNYHQLDMLTAAVSISAVLTKFKREHEVIYIIPKDYTDEKDLLFLGELNVGIKTPSPAKPLIITSIGPNTNAQQIPTNYRGAKAYSNTLTKNRAGDLNTMTLPEDEASNNTCHIESVASFSAAFDSLHVKSKISLLGAERYGWDTVLFVSHIIEDDFNKQKYGEFIKDKNITRTHATVKKARELETLRAEQDHRRLALIKDKIKESFSAEDAALNDFKVTNFGRWEVEPRLVFELDYTLPVNAPAIENSIIFSVKNLTTHVGKLLEPERTFDIYLPWKKEVTHMVTLTGFNAEQSSGLEQFNKSFDAEDLSFSSSFETENNTLKIYSKESVGETNFKKEDWNRLVDFQKAIYDFKNIKLKIPVR